MVPKMSTCRRDFLIKNEELLENIMKFGIKSTILLKRICSEPIYNEKYLITEIKSYEEIISTKFNGDLTRKEVSQCICLSVILIDSVLEQVKAIILKYF